MKDWVTKNGLLLAILLAPFVLLVLVWGQIPDEVPIHWNIDGEADGFAAKGPGLFLIPALGLFIQAIFWVVPLIDPKKRTEEFQRTINLMQIIFGLFFLALIGIMILAWLGLIQNTGSLVLPAVALLLGVVGNYFTRLRPNYFFGIRTPWTLENESNWRKTHRFGGRLWVLGAAVLLCIFPFFQPKEYFGLFMAGVMLMAIGPLVYSFLLYKKGN